MFRSACAGWFAGNLLASLAGPGPFRRAASRFAMVSHSVAFLIVSRWWCMGVGAWAWMQMLEAIYQTSASDCLIGGNIYLYPLLTALVSFLCFLTGTETQVAEQFQGQIWISVGIASAMAMAASFGTTGFSTLATVRRKIETLYNILNTDTAAFASEAAVGRTPADPILGGSAAPRQDRGVSGTPAPDRDSLSSVETRMSGPALTGDSAVSDNSAGKSCRCPFEDVVVQKKVGHGSFGVVYQAMQGGNQPVAVKVIPARHDARQKSSPLREARLSVDLVHPCVIRTLKYSARHMPQAGQSLGDDDDDEEMEYGSLLTNPEELAAAEAELKPLELWIMQEWCDMGTLANFCTRPRFSSQDISEACRIVADIASGGEFLHEREIIHGDLTGNNVLMASTDANRRGYICKVCDFGLARVLEGNTSAIFTTTMGTVTHMPPELFQLERSTIRLSKKADIYALGILLWQVVMGQMPFATMHAPQVILFVARGRRLQLDESVPEELCDLYRKCVLEDPRARPTFTEAFSKLCGLALDD
eukprot:CAMPEP_0176097760 /NCGR_PEP_ID=MMETSP0120_2-20121206/49015_1 /TAXON_ID=160619 /ORGANISM="Kryptoperidinium foliaceum, Strain CCMP 1326" /LENGTH=531 /DNA_ID=CAMNT_0017431763 /DNA_START=1 /DNA_END=1596 /DNA_ORIENTATION=+